MRALITGGCGFIGSHLVDKLTAAGDEVVVVDNLSNGDATRLPRGVQFWHMDITSSALPPRCGTESARFRPDVIYHLAAQISVTDSVARPAYDAHINIMGTINVLDAACAAGARVVFASSGGAVYAPGAGRHAVGDPCFPESPYGLSKLSAEGYVHLAPGRHAILRLANVYGPRQDAHGEGGVVACFAGTKKPVIYGDGEQTRDFVYVGDVVEAFRLAGVSRKAGVWNVGTGEETSINALATRFRYDVPPEHEAARPGEVRQSVLSIEKTRVGLNWAPKVTLADGIRRTQRWVDGGEAPNGLC